MKAEEFLSMQSRLDIKIASDIREVSHLRELSTQLFAQTSGERVSGSHHCDAPFTRLIEKIVDLEREIDSEIDSFVDVRNDIRAAIEEMDNPRLQAVLQYRYLQNLSWRAIAQKMYAERTSVYKWHKKALEQIKLPEKYAVL